MECPICFDEILGNINIITTECGHTFHCKCLMHNASVNGFGCPMCRQVMVEEGKEEDSDDEFDGEDDDDDDEDDDSDDTAGYSQDIRTDPENLENHLLRGMRWLFQQHEVSEADAEAVSVVSVAGTHNIIPLDGHSWAKMRWKSLMHRAFRTRTCGRLICILPSRSSSSACRLKRQMTRFWIN